MSFCGTIRERDRWKFLGLAGTCGGLASQLLDLMIKKEAEKEGKPPYGAKKGEQMQLFALDTETRERFTKFAKNLRWHAEEHSIHDESYWKGYREHEYNDYDFYMFFAGYSDEELNKAADALEKIGDGGTLEEYKEIMDFLHAMESRARAKVDRGGCF